MTFFALTRTKKLHPSTIKYAEMKIGVLIVTTTKQRDCAKQFWVRRGGKISYQKIADDKYVIKRIL